MKIHSRKGQRGSILVICLVIAGFGTIGAATFFSLIQAKAEETKTMKESTGRRVRQSNGLALAREIVLRKYVDTVTGPAADESHSLPDGWGGILISPFNQAPMSTTAATRLQKTGAVPHVSYSTDVTVTTNDGVDVRPWQFQIKSATPSMMRDLLVVHEPTINEADRIIIEDVRVEGRAFIWVAGAKDQLKDLAAERVFMVDTEAFDKVELFDLAGNEMMPENFPFMNNTNGKIRGEDRPYYDGRLSVVDNEDLSVPSYVELINSKAQPPLELDGLVEFPLFTTDPITLSLPDGSVIHDDNGDGGGFEAGGYPDDVYTVIRQALEAYVRTHAAAYKALEIVDRQKYDHDDLDLPGDPVVSFDLWHDNSHDFDGKDGVPVVTAELSVEAAVVTLDLAAAMTDLGGPNPALGGWWPPALPASDAPFFTLNNPYPEGAWDNAVAGSSGNGQVQVRIADQTANVHLTNNTEVLVLKGQVDAASGDAAALAEPLMIVQTNAFDTELKLEDIELRGINRRPLVLAMKQDYDPATVQEAKDDGKGRGGSGSGGKDVTHKDIDVKFNDDYTPNFPKWRIMMELENTPLVIDVGDVGGGATFFGVLRTDASLYGDGGELTLERDPDMGEGIDVIGLRYAWLETFQN